MKALTHPALSYVRQCLLRVGCALLVALLPAVGAAATTVTQSLDAGWQFRLAPGDSHAVAHPAAARWLPASVPGTVQTDLLAAKLVADPFWRDNEAAIQWAGLSDWHYRTTFEVDAATLARRHIELVFEGLDTFADVRLNGHPILAADNMFRRWHVPVKALLHAGKNTLEVQLYSPIRHVLPLIAKQPYHLPGEFDSEFGDLPPGQFPLAYTRKAAYQYGWDWGPRIVTEGIWHPVKLESWDGLRLADFHIAQPLVTAAVARLQAQLEVDADHAGPAHVALRWTAPDGTTHALRRDVTLAAGANRLSLPFQIARPQRWWPVGYGAPNRYDFHVEVDAGGKLVDRASRKTGLRSVELRRQKDQWGKSFEFVINGVPIFAKGANFIPMDSFPNRVTPARIDQLLESARDANMNLLRIWGGGYYLPDHFYAEADKLGLMIWQEFMFGGPIPPPSAAFRDNARIEATQQVKRLRDHPAIVLWCGNNEVEDGWEYFGIQKQLRGQGASEAEIQRIGDGMHTLFRKTLREVVAQYEPSVPYWSSSPGTDGEGPVNVTGNGDYHYWDVWSGKALPATAYVDVTPRFMSEYGLQSMPVMATIDSFTTPSDRTLDSRVIRAHQKYLRGKHYDESTGNQRLLLYVERDYGKPKDFAAMVYLSQVMQAEGIELGADHLRASRPQSMGSLYWQLNDVWPGATWSSIDYYGRWKALQYHAKRFYAPLRVVPIRKSGRTQVSLVSDRTAPFDAQLRVRVLDMDGKLLWEHTQDVRVAALASTPAGDYTDAQLLRGASPRHTVAVFELLDHGQSLSRHLLYFGQPKDLALPDPGLHAELSADGHSLTVSAQHLAREVWIDFGDLDARLSDNAFDLLPGQQVTLRVESAADPAALRRALQMRSLHGAAVGTP